MAETCPALTLLEVRGNELEAAGLGELPPTLTELAAAGNPFTGAENWRAAVCRRFQS